MKNYMYHARANNFHVIFLKKNISPISVHVYLKSFPTEFVKAVVNITPRRERERGGVLQSIFFKITYTGSSYRTIESHDFTGYLMCKK